MADTINIGTETKQWLLISEAKRWVGVSEVGGNNKGQLVKIFQKAVDGVAENEPWCMSFAQYCIKQVDKVMKIIKPTRQETWLIGSESCSAVYSAAPAAARLSKPVPGCLVIWRHDSDGGGHVGIVTEVLSDAYFMTVEGNTGPSAGVEAEGDGVYAKKRAMAGSGDMKIRGFLLPWS